MPVLLALVLMGGLAAEAHASLIVNTPAGVGPGQSFIVVFVDTTIGHATDGSIADYNALITTAASGNITYPGGTISSWQILGATAAADPAASVFSSTLPIYDDKGDKLATNGATWLAGGDTPLYSQTGSGAGGRPTWTGLGENGAPAAGNTLGSTNVTYGYPDVYIEGGLDSGTTAATGYGVYFGFATFTAAEPTPEPGTFTLSLMGLAAVGVFCLARRRRATFCQAS
jgi:MYXO-CTERM domain-containing protein